MNKIIVIIVILAIGVAFVVWQATTKTDTLNIEQTIDTIQASNCSELPSRSELFLKSQSTFVRSLGEIENKCGSKVTDIIKYSIKIPKDDYSSKLLGFKVIEDINNMVEADIKPMIFLEIGKDWSEEDFAKLERGELDIHTITLLQSISSAGIDDNEINAFILIPKPNLPNWNGKYISPEKYRTYIQKLFPIISTIYPSVPIGMEFNSSTYEDLPFSYEEKEYLSLIPYLSGISDFDIKILGVEGLPWTPEIRSAGDSVFDPKEYLATNELMTAAEYIGINNVFIETGTFSAMYLNDDTAITPIPADIRQNLLNDTLTVLTKLKAENFDTTLILKSYEDISSEGTDWGYYGSQYTEKTLHEKVLLDFLRNLNQKKIDIVMNYN